MEVGAGGNDFRTNQTGVRIVTTAGWMRASTCWMFVGAAMVPVPLPPAAGDRTAAVVVSRSGAEIRPATAPAAEMLRIRGSGYGPVHAGRWALTPASTTENFWRR